jgi:hypothetical protein
MSAVDSYHRLDIAYLVGQNFGGREIGRQSTFRHAAAERLSNARTLLTNDVPG